MKSPERQSVVIKPFPISARAWETVRSGLLSPGDEFKKNVEKERSIIQSHYPFLDVFIHGLSTEVAEGAGVSPVFYRAGLYAGFSAYRNEAGIRKGVIPNITEDILITFMIRDIGFTQDPTLTDKKLMKENHERMFESFKTQESQVWRSLQRIRFTSEDEQYGLYFGISAINKLIKAQCASIKG